MSPKAFAALAVATGVCILLALGAVLSRDRPVTSIETSGPLFPDLIQHANEAAAVRVTSADGQLTIERKGNDWVLKERGGYPVDSDKVRALVLGLAGLELVEPRTADPERLARLELEEPTAKDAKSHQVEILGADGKPIAAAVVGRSRYGLYGGGGSGIYVRKAGDNQSWLASGSVEVPKAATDLVDTRILDLAEGDVARVTVEGPGGPVLTVTRAAPGGALSLEATLPEGRIADQDKIDLVPSALANLAFEDVLPAAEMPIPKDAPATRFTAFDGREIVVRSLTKGEGDKAETWVQVTADNVPPLQAPPADAATKAADEMKALAAKVAGWTYKVPSYLAERFRPTVDGLTKPATS